MEFKSKRNIKSLRICLKKLWERIWKNYMIRENWVKPLLENWRNKFLSRESSSLELFCRKERKCQTEKNSGLDFSQLKLFSGRSFLWINLQEVMLLTWIKFCYNMSVKARYTTGACLGPCQIFIREPCLRKSLAVLNNLFVKMLQRRCLTGW